MKVIPRVTEAIRNNNAVLGIDSNEQNAEYPWNARSVIAILVYCSCVLSTGGYLFGEAETFGEYMDSVSITTATLIDTYTYLSFFLRLKQFSTFVNTLEETFQESM